MMHSANRALAQWVVLLVHCIVALALLNVFYADMYLVPFRIPFATFGWGMKPVMAQETGGVAQGCEVGFESDTYRIGPGERVMIPVRINDTRLIRDAFMIDVYYPLTILTYTGDYHGGDIDTTLFLVHQPDPDMPLIKVGGVIGPERSGNKGGSGGPGTIVSLVFTGSTDTEGCGELTLRLMDDLEGALISKGRVCCSKGEARE